MKNTLAALVLACSPLAFAAVPAFPGAEGFGANATGGRGGSVYEVTNLNDSGPGSLRDAVSQPDRTVVFRVSGTIDLESRLSVSQPNITIAGQTAPGDGITLRKHELFIANTKNVIVRYIRSRPGDEAKVELDAVTIWASRDVILDHCSMSWSTDSLNDVVKESGNITVQWCLLAEPLVVSVHSKGEHGYATGWDGRLPNGDKTGGGGGSFHHNLIAHAASRAPRIGYFKTGRGLIDCRNNVIYNSGPSYGGETDDFNYVANYYRPGPDSPKLRDNSGIFDVWSDDSRMYVAGNVWEGKGEVAVKFKAAKTNLGESKPGAPEVCLVKAPFEVASVQTDTAQVAYERVIKDAGAVLPKRDTVDQRVIGDVVNRTGRLVNSPSDVGGWPELKSAPAPADTDHDGIPDAWELAHGLDPKNAGDGAKLTTAGYSNLEVYLNELPAK